jgi:hypothetical protein
MSLRKLLPAATGLCLAAYATASPAGEFGKELLGGDVPGWALGHHRCQATLISPRMALANARCVKAYPSEIFLHLDDMTRAKGTVIAPATVRGPHDDIAAIVLDQAVDRPLVPIPSYRSEQQMVVEGTPLTVYGPLKRSAPFDWRKPIMKAEPLGVIRYDYFMGVGGRVPFEPVAPASVADSFRIWNYGRPTNAVLADMLGHADSVIAIPPWLTRDGAMYYFPFDNRGGAILAGKGAAQGLVSLSTESHFHVRVSNFWPRAYRIMLDHGLREDALSLALRVLHPFKGADGHAAAKDWRDSMRELPLGSIWPREHKDSRKIEFFRLVKASPDGRPGPLPPGSRDGNGWEYLGEELPSLASATTPFRGSPLAAPDDGKTPIGTMAVNVRRADGGVEYYRLLAIGNDGRLAPFPRPGQQSRHWAYVGTNLTAVNLSRDIDFQQSLHLDQSRPPIRVANEACEGALISRRAIITAADCVADGGPTRFKLLETGEILVGKGFRSQAQAQAPADTTGLTGLGLVVLDDPASLKDGQRPYVNSYQLERQLLSASVGDKLLQQRMPMTKEDWEQQLVLFSYRARATVRYGRQVLANPSWTLPRGKVMFLKGVREEQTWGPFAVMRDGLEGSPRMSHHWPWIYRTLMNAGAREDALILASQVLNPWQDIEHALRLPLTRRRVQQSRLGHLRPDLLDWQSFDRRGVVGRVYAYDNPWTAEVEFFRLAADRGSNGYGYFPIDRKDNEEWEYLGTELPSCDVVLTPVKAGSPGGNGSAGELFVHWSDVNRRLEYFELVAPFAEGGYEPPPSNGTDSRHWRYRGTDLPTPPADEGGPGGCA